LEFFVIFVIVWALWPSNVGKYLAEVEMWFKYYSKNQKDELHYELVKARAKNIARIRKNKEKKKND